MIIGASDDELVTLKGFNYLNSVYHCLVSYHKPFHLYLIQRLALLEGEVLEVPEFEVSTGVSTDQVVIVQGCPNCTH